MKRRPKKIHEEIKRSQSREKTSQFVLDEYVEQKSRSEMVIKSKEGLDIEEYDYDEKIKQKILRAS